MKLFIQDHQWAGATIVIAETPEQATEIASKDNNSFYVATKPWDEIRALDNPLHIELYGDR